MKLKTSVMLLMSIIILSCNPPIKEEPRVEEKPNLVLAGKIDEYFDALKGLKKFNGGVLLQQGEDVIIFKDYNMQSDEGNSLHVNKHSQFDIHSISKLMAKACIVKLETEGLINKGDKIKKYIPDFPRGELITIQHLLDNSSGLPRRFEDPPGNLIDKSPEDLVELIKKEELLFTPGSETLYSNLGYQLIYYIISTITNKPFVQYLNDEFFIPLGMNKTGAHFFLNKNNLTDPIINHVYDDDNDEIVVVPNYLKTEKNQAKLYSDIEDLLKFINHVKKEPYKDALKRKSGKLGWSGGGDGVFSHAEANLEADYQFILFSSYDEIPFGTILEDVEKIMTDQPYVLPKEINRKPVRLSRDLMEKFVGKFDMKEFNHDEFEIRIEEDDFVFYQNGERQGVLQAENDTTLFGDPKDEDYFILRENQEGTYNLIYKYKQIDFVGEGK